MIEAGILHLVVALGVGQRVVRLAEVPLAGEEGLVAALSSAPRPASTPPPAAAALALEGHGGHAAAVRDAPGLHRRPAGRAARLGVDGGGSPPSPPPGGGFGLQGGLAAKARAVAPISVRRVHENARSLFMHSSFPNDAAEADVAC